MEMKHSAQRGVPTPKTAVGEATKTPLRSIGASVLCEVARIPSKTTIVELLPTANTWLDVAATAYKSSVVLLPTADQRVPG